MRDSKNKVVEEVGTDHRARGDTLGGVVNGMVTVVEGVIVDGRYRKWSLFVGSNICKYPIWVVAAKLSHCPVLLHADSGVISCIHQAPRHTDQDGKTVTSSFHSSWVLTFHNSAKRADDFLCHLAERIS
ncbi:hypothetical protein Tco_0392524 [Tanacetum coccineum]